MWYCHLLVLLVSELICRDLPCQKLFYIYIHYPFIPIIQVFQCLSNGIMTTSSGSESITIVTEYLFINIRYRLCYCLLDSSVKCCGYSQWSFLTIVFRNVYSSDWFRYICSVSKRCNDFLSVLPYIISQFFYSNSINTTRTFIGNYLFIGSVQIFFDKITSINSIVVTPLTYPKIHT